MSLPRRLARLRSAKPPHNAFSTVVARACSSDHRTLAHAQKIFTTSPYSPGSPLFLPNGADMMNKLVACLRAHYPRFGFREVLTPTIYKTSLWQVSGHWENYAEHMFEVRGGGSAVGKGELEEETYGLKAMNCPGHCLIFASEPRSYRQLPIRYSDFGALHRNEDSGAITGLTRVRKFHIDDGHIFCAPSQIEDEIKATINFIRIVYKDIFDLGDYRLVLSTRPEKRIGSEEEWDSAETQLMGALDATKMQWSVSEADGAYYGPKIDLLLTDASGKEHQTATIQLDFQLPKRFGLKYSTDGHDGRTAQPVLVHRAILGSLERFLALLIEHYDGCYPFWISPLPATVLTVNQSPDVVAYAQEVARDVGGASYRPSIHVEVDASARTLSKKIHAARAAGYNFILVVGERDVGTKTMSLSMSNQRQSDRSREVLQKVAGLPAAQGRIDLPLATVRTYFGRLQDGYL
jgi:threonyl-tRNA synthetase